MTLAASPSRVHESVTTQPRHFFAAWQILPAAFALLVMFLAFTPDGVAEPLQALAGWLVVGAVAALAVTAIVKGLERLLDCETD